MFEPLTRLFPVAVGPRNLKEGLFFPRYARYFAPWQQVEVGAFRFALVLLTLLAYLDALASTLGSAYSFGAYLHASCMLAMLLNVFVPHLVVTLATGRLMPGTVTGVLLIARVTVTSL